MGLVPSLAWRRGHPSGRPSAHSRLVSRRPPTEPSLTSVPTQSSQCAKHLSAAPHCIVYQLFLAMWAPGRSFISPRSVSRRPTEPRPVWWHHGPARAWTLTQLVRVFIAAASEDWFQERASSLVAQARVRLSSLGEPPTERASSSVVAHWPGTRVDSHSARQSVHSRRL